MYSLAQKHFKRHDPKLYEFSLQFDIDNLEQSDDLFQDIVWTIIGQQLSGKAADTIFDRFKALFPKGHLTAERILKLKDSDIRACGISGAKMRAIRDLSQKVIAGDVNIEKLSSLSDAEVFDELVSVKGIGPWTAEMILMFSLGRPDIFSMGDLILRKEIMTLHGWKKSPSEKRLAEVFSRWSPYRTYAARILWRIADSRKKSPKK